MWNQYKRSKISYRINIHILYSNFGKFLNHLKLQLVFFCFCQIKDLELDVDVISKYSGREEEASEAAVQVNWLQFYQPTDQVS
jgi:hypothetical protein